MQFLTNVTRFWNRDVVNVDVKMIDGQKIVPLMKVGDETSNVIDRPT